MATHDESDEMRDRTTAELIELVEGLLRDEGDPDEAYDAVHELGRRKAAGAVDVLLRLLSEDEAESDNDATLALREIGAATVEPVLGRLPSVTPGSRLHWALCEILGDAGVRDERIYDALRHLLEVSPMFGAVCLGNYGEPRALPLLSRGLHRTEMTGKLMRDQIVIEYRAAILALGGTLSPRGQDKVAQYHRLADAQLGFLDDAPPARNAPCPCGSGKKYKRCHGRDDPDD